MAALPGMTKNTTAKLSSVESHDAPRDGTGIAHGNTSTKGGGIENFHASDSNNDDEDCNAIQDISGPVPDLSCSCLLGHDKTFLHCDLEPELDSGKDQIGDVLPDTCANTADNTIRLVLHIGCTTNDKPECVTSAHGYAEVRIGWNKEMPRWRKGSVLLYAIRKDGFPPLLRGKIEEAMETAIRMWGSIGVSFKQVGDRDPATFVVVYSNWNVAGYASAFFPNEPLRTLTVYRRSIEASDCLANILAHEVGHILGLRHEFAHTGLYEWGSPCVLVGSDNAQSVMNYFENPEEYQVTEQDRQELNIIYEYNEPTFKVYGDESKYTEWSVVDVDPEVRLPFS
ncbi:hypothetical protein TrVFT333_003661 [Trichoderma virens FT-333]|nr:hypothetical protein TrVFT333_003661 [Trichoderma virens FT-333]